jgi:hypothetical protein
VQTLNPRRFERSDAIDARLDPLPGAIRAPARERVAREASLTGLGDRKHSVLTEREQLDSLGGANCGVCVPENDTHAPQFIPTV